MRDGRISVIRLWQRIVVPLQGDVSDEIAVLLIDDILHAIRETKAVGLVVDVTGVWSVDSHLCFTLTKIAGAARLMGTPTVICGLSASIALALDAMGADFKGAETALALEDALEMLGVAPRFHAVASSLGDQATASLRPEPLVEPLSRTGQ